jgi:hypothetical protein
MSKWAGEEKPRSCFLNLIIDQTAECGHLLNIC